jgi:tRNA threonylcarbamoyladenosine modification (KEOPS) complex Cgi121 subunit
MMDSMLKKASATGASILVLDGSVVFGSDHLASALYHARRAVEEGRNASDSLQMETLLYSSGERQLSSAIRKMSVSESTTVVVVARLSEDGFEPGEGWCPLPRRPESVELDSLQRYGIDRSEAETTRADLLSDLILERVANVDLIKK